MILTDRDNRDHLVSLGVSKMLHTSRLALLAAIEALSITRFPSRPVPTATPHTIKIIEFLPATQPVLHPPLRPMYKRDRYRIHLPSHDRSPLSHVDCSLLRVCPEYLSPCSKANAAIRRCIQQLGLNPSDLNANWLCVLRITSFSFLASCISVASTVNYCLQMIHCFFVLLPLFENPSAVQARRSSAPGGRLCAPGGRL